MRKTLIALSLLASQASGAAELEVSGRVGAEWRHYLQDALYSGQHNDSSVSIMAEPEFYWEWNGGDNSVLFKPFVRIDQYDNERSHADIRELVWTHVADDWELKAGISKVFWGVTEFQHLVDVINQNDAVEDIDGEDKLGQPMVNLSMVRDWGTLDLFMLAGFRERTFAGDEGRLRSGLVVNTDKARYQSSAAENHVDAAIRYSNSVGDYDYGVHWFRGTNRDPVLIAESGELIPLYEQMNQVGVDVQATKGDWLWKFESIYRDSDSHSFAAAQGGFEYTFVGINETAMDLGLLMEYGWNSRGTDAVTGNQNDLFLGARLTLNDAESTELLAGIGHDLDYDSTSFTVEASRRIGDSWKLSVDARVFDSDNSNDSLYAVRQDDQIQLTMEYYY